MTNQSVYFKIPHSESSSCLLYALASIFGLTLRPSGFRYRSARSPVSVIPEPLSHECAFHVPLIVRRIRCFIKHLNTDLCCHLKQHTLDLMKSNLFRGYITPLRGIFTISSEKTGWLGIFTLLSTATRGLYGLICMP